MKHYFLLFFCAGLLLVACEGNSTSDASPDEQDHTAVLNAFLDSVTNAAILREPEWESSLGRRSRYSAWNDYSDEGSLEEIRIREREWEALQERVDFEQLDAQGKISYRLFEDKVRLMKASEPYIHHSYPVEQMHGIQAELPSFLINVHRVDSLEDAEAYIERLRGVPGVMRQIVAKMRVRQEKGIVPPKFVFPYVLADSRNIISGYPFDGKGEATLWTDFREKVEGLEIDEAAKAALKTEGEAALKDSVGWGYAHLIGCLEDLEQIATTDDGAWKFPEGEGYYQYRLQRITTTEMSADEIHELGLQEVERIHGEMRAIMAKVEFEGDLQDFFAFMRTDPQFYYPNTEAGRQAYLDRVTLVMDSMRKRLPDFFLNLPKAEMQVKRVEAYREKSAGKAFYNRPAPDGSRPGTYYANLYDMANMPNYQMEALAFHEGIPGHHMQLATAIELTGLPEFRRYSSYTAYIEGWALYSEKLAREIGFYADPYADFGRLAMELWRACRLVVDTGIHSKKWSREKAIDYLKENTPNPEGDIVKAIERYIVMPGQATAYKIGMLKIEELRAKAESEMGDAFDVRKFHDVVLSNGAVTLNLLEELVDDYIAGGSAS